MTVLHRHVVRCSRIVSQLSHRACPSGWRTGPRAVWPGSPRRSSGMTVASGLRTYTPSMRRTDLDNRGLALPLSAPVPTVLAWCRQRRRRARPRRAPWQRREDQYGGHWRSTPLLIVRSMKRGRKIRGAVRDVVAGASWSRSWNATCWVRRRWCMPAVAARAAGQRGCEVGRVRGRQLPVLALRPTQDRLGDRGAAGSERQGRCLGPGGSPHQRRIGGCEPM